MKRIKKASAIFGMGDALNMRAFLLSYCKQKNISPAQIAIYTEKHFWMFEGLGFIRGKFREEFNNLIPYKNFGFYDLPKIVDLPELDKNIALNAGIDYSFESCFLLPKYEPPKVELPERYITFNTGFGEFSGRVGDKDYICLKSWKKEFWQELVKKIGVPCVQIGAGKSCEIIKGAINLVDKLTIKESAEVMRKALFHIDMEGGLSILNQHLGKKSVVLFGATAIENQGREFNLNLSSNVCPPCYEWKGATVKVLYAKKSDLKCGLKCMRELKPSYVLAEIKKTGWLKNGAQIESKYIKE